MVPKFRFRYSFNCNKQKEMRESLFRKYFIFLLNIIVSRKMLLLYALCLSLHVHAQVRKLYGYSQALYGGAIQANDNIENKQENEKPIQPANTRYFIFAEIEKKNVVFPLQLWINKKLYQFTVDSIKQFPFILLSSNGGESLSKDTLVKSASGYILQLRNPILIKQQNIPKNIRTIVRENELVLIYQYKGKLHKFFLQHLKQVSPIFAP